MDRAIAPAADEPLTYQEDIPPFWTRLGKFFGYPLQAGPLMTLGILSAASMVSAFVGGLFRGLLAYLFLRYAFSVMEHAARGDFNADSPDISMWGNADRRPMKQTVVFLFYLAILFGLATISAQPVPPSPEKVAAAQQAQQRLAQLQEAAEREEAGADADAEDGPAVLALREEMMRQASEPSAAADEPEVKLPAWFYVLAILAALPLPGAVMVIAVEDNLVRALNPVSAFNYIAAMGSTYFVLWVFFALILGARDLVMKMAADLPAIARFPIETLLTSYLTLALFVMMGYCLYQYHKELGYDVKVDFDDMREKEAAAKKGARPVDPLTAQVNAFVKEGKLDDAFRLVLDGMRYDKLNVDLNEKAHNLYLLKGDEAKTLQHGQQYLKALVAAEKGARALVLLKKLRALDAGFAPEPDVILGLAKAAAQARDFNQAIELVKGFDKRFPGHADIPGVYFLGAKITSEHLREDAKAIAILRVLLHKYPEASVKAEASQYLAVLTSVAPMKPAAASA